MPNGQPIQKVILTSGLGKSTIIASPRVSIPMPDGATSPASSGSGSQAGQSGSSSSTQGSGKNG